MEETICNGCGEVMLELDQIDERGGLRRNYHIACFPKEPDTKATDDDCF